MIAVQEYTSAADMIAHYAANRQKLMGTPPPPKPAPRIVKPTWTTRGDTTTRAGWMFMNQEKKCATVVKHFKAGDTYKTLAFRVSQEIGYHVSHSAIGGLYARNKDGLLSDIFFSRGYGSDRPKIGKCEHKIPSPEECADALHWAYVRTVGPIKDEDAPRYYTASALIAEMCETYDVTEEEILGSSRFQNVALPRAKIMRVVTQLSGHSNAKMARRFNRDHTTIFASIKKINRMMADNHPDVADMKGWLQK